MKRVYFNCWYFPRLIYLTLFKLDGSKSLQKSGLLGNLGVGVGEEDIDDLFGVWRELALAQGGKNFYHFYIFL